MLTYFTELLIQLHSYKNSMSMFAARLPMPMSKMYSNHPTRYSGRPAVEASSAHL